MTKNDQPRAKPQDSGYYEHLLRLRADFEAKYRRDLAAIGITPAEGFTVTCPSCRRSSWLRLPKESQWRRSELHFACPTGCGYAGYLPMFTPQPHQDIPAGYDTHSTCKSCDVEFVTDGVVVRRPCCGIENPRELMARTIRYIESRIASQDSDEGRRNELELLVMMLVGRFDGLMRSMVGLARDNERYRQSLDPNGGATAKAGITWPEKISFQNLENARKRLLKATGFWDMATAAGDWKAVVRLFKKRHTIAHRLGVADDEYISGTLDPAARPGKQVALTVEELMGAAGDCQKMVLTFFGKFLS